MLVKAQKCRDDFTRRHPRGSLRFLFRISQCGHPLIMCLAILNRVTTIYWYHFNSTHLYDFTFYTQPSRTTQQQMLLYGICSTCIDEPAGADWTMTLITIQNEWLFIIFMCCVCAQVECSTVYTACWVLTYCCVSDGDGSTTGSNSSLSDRKMQGKLSPPVNTITYTVSALLYLHYIHIHS